MFRISELGKQVGLSRSTLLYYEKLGIIAGDRQVNGYRQYSQSDVQRLTLLQELQAAGLTLQECLACLDARIKRSELHKRLQALDAEITQKQDARELLASMLGEGSMRHWHQAVETAAPLAHMKWLMTQGFDEKQALRLRWLSKDMNAHDEYMADFEEIFMGLERLGPGDDLDTLKALEYIPYRSGSLIEIGCGKGLVSLLLAKHSNFDITAIDNDEYLLNCLQEKMNEESSELSISSLCISMTELSDMEEFNLVWAEGSAYIMGIKQALSEWQKVIKPNGYLVLTDLIWLTDKRSKEVKDFWLKNYPDMSSLSERINLMESAGYKLIDSFTLSLKAWENYLTPLKKSLENLKLKHWGSNAYGDLCRELRIHENYLGQYGYQFFILERKT